MRLTAVRERRDTLHYYI